MPFYGHFSSLSVCLLVVSFLCRVFVKDVLVCSLFSPRGHFFLDGPAFSPLLTSHLHAWQSQENELINDAAVDGVQCCVGFSSV